MTLFWKHNFCRYNHVGILLVGVSVPPGTNNFKMRLWMDPNMTSVHTEREKLGQLDAQCTGRVSLKTEAVIWATHLQTQKYQGLLRTPSTEEKSGCGPQSSVLTALLTLFYSFRQPKQNRNDHKVKRCVASFIVLATNIHFRTFILKHWVKSNATRSK